MNNRVFYLNFPFRNPELQSSSSAMGESEGIKEEDEFDLEESASSASSGACTVEEAADSIITGHSAARK